MRWENIERRGWHKFARALPAFFAAAAVCGVSLGIQYAFAAAATRHTVPGYVPVAISKAA